MSVSVIITRTSNSTISSATTCGSDWLHLSISGGHLKNLKPPLMTVLAIFATAYILSLVACAGSSDANKAAPAAPDTQRPAGSSLSSGSDGKNLQPLDPKDLRECNDDEFTTLIKWSKALEASESLIDTVGGKKSTQAVNAALVAIKLCDQVEFYHTVKPCKKTKVERLITTPKVQKVIVTAYEPYTIIKRCQPTENYLLKFDLRPDPEVDEPAPVVTPPVQPTPVAPPVVNPPQVNPPQPTGPSGEANDLRQCSADEFAKLNQWRSYVDIANKNLSRLGSPANWKFDANALEATSAATKSCETLMAYHRAQPCKREKSYTEATLREQCAGARTYYYDFAQRTESLITPNARLMFDTSVLQDRSFVSGPSSLSYGQCVITNQSQNSISYAGEKVLIKEARVYTDSLQMFAMVTAEGLKFECYGLDFQSAATSLTEVMKLLNAKGTKIPLSYELN